MISDNTGAEKLARAITALLVEKSGLDIKMFNVGEDNPITYYYINVTGKSNSHVSSLADDILEKMSENGRDALRVEGRSGNSWILVDFGDVIVNIFDRESRDFYKFDRLIKEEYLVDISDIVEEVDKKFQINTAKED